MLGSQYDNGTSEKSSLETLAKPEGLSGSREAVGDREDGELANRVKKNRPASAESLLDVGAAGEKIQHLMPVAVDQPRLERDGETRVERDRTGLFEAIELAAIDVDVRCVQFLPDHPEITESIRGVPAGTRKFTRHKCGADIVMHAADLHGRMMMGLRRRVDCECSRIRMRQQESFSRS